MLIYHMPIICSKVKKMSFLFHRKCWRKKPQSPFPSLSAFLGSLPTVEDPCLSQGGQNREKRGVLSNILSFPGQPQAEKITVAMEKVREQCASRPTHGTWQRWEKLQKSYVLPSTAQQNPGFLCTHSGRNSSLGLHRAEHVHAASSWGLWLTSSARP